MNPEVRYAVELTPQPAELGVAVGESIAIANTSLEDLPVTVELLDLSGNVVATGEHMAGRVETNTRGVEPGLYALRLTRPEDTAVSSRIRGSLIWLKSTNNASNRALSWALSLTLSLSIWRAAPSDAPPTRRASG